MGKRREGDVKKRQALKVGLLTNHQIGPYRDYIIFNSIGRVGLLKANRSCMTALLT